jgi:hypothetical protein
MPFETRELILDIDLSPAVTSFECKQGSSTKVPPPPPAPQECKQGSSTKAPPGPPGECKQGSSTKAPPKGSSLGADEELAVLLHELREVAVR